MSIISWIVVGLIAGWLAGVLVKGSGFGLFGNIIVGIIGGVLGGWLASSVFNMGAGVNGFNLGSILVAFVGAVVLLLIVGMFTGGRRAVR
ncbi:MAG: GlsB/YeaQ/YmgE family stress response membrane protein [Chloroflexi bacterium HGW-Chloroflexi-10]|nr:MAG: GlsB/YeaQ/YmgE family stress response membrane protein [Chloroflexi bacterium HGW-Chloroflexi-10]